MSREEIQVDLQALEDYIADPGLPMQNIQAAVGINEQTVYARKKHDEEFNRAYQRGMVRREAACIHNNGSNPDEIVLRAIGLGFDTRGELKRALGFGYDVIEKAIERNAGDIDTSSRGMVERLSLKISLPDADEARAQELVESQEIIEDTAKPSEIVEASDEEEDFTREDFTESLKRASVPSVTLDSKGRRNPRAVDIDIVRAGELRAKGMSMQSIADALGVNIWTFNDRRKQIPELEDALEKGWQAYHDTHGNGSFDLPKALFQGASGNGHKALEIRMEDHKEESFSIDSYLKIAALIEGRRFIDMEALDRVWELANPGISPPSMEGTA